MTRDTDLVQNRDESLLVQLQGKIGNRAIQQFLHLDHNLGNLSGLTMGTTQLNLTREPSTHHIMRQGLPAQTVTKWQSLVSKGYDEQKQNNPQGMEANFAEALKLIEPNFNIARGGYAAPTKLKPGVNLDILFTEDQGKAGFVIGDKFTSQLPLDGTNPDSVIIIGKTAFLRDSPINTIMTLEHEKTHTSHQRSSLSLLKEWSEKADRKKFAKEFQKEKLKLEKAASKAPPGAVQIESGLAEIKARMIRDWHKAKKGRVTPEMELLHEQAGTMKVKHFDSEVLSGLAGFMKGFPLVEIKNGVPVQDVFHELTYYPAEQGFWTKNSEAVKKQYQQTLSSFYCKTLNDMQRKAFDKHLEDYKNKKWPVDVANYFKMLESMRCKK